MDSRSSICGTAEKGQGPGRIEVGGDALQGVSGISVGHDDEATSIR